MLILKISRSLRSLKCRMSCDLVLRCLKWIPVIFIFLILGWSYYSYVYQLCFLIVESWIEKIFLLLFYHVSFFMLLWSYYQTIFTDISRVPHQFKISNAEMDQIMRAKSQEEQIRLLKTLSKELPLLNCTVNNCVRFCDKCQQIKPDRSHHCSVCGVCTLKMDHHCPWVNNCVNYSNYKYFLLFLMYGLWYCIYVVVTLLSYFIKFWKGELQGLGRFHLLFLFVIAVMFAFSLVSLFGYHIYLVLKNRTTLEAFRCPIFNNDDGNGGPDKNGFFLTYSDNFQQVFGIDKRKWFLPVDTSLGDGIRYPVHRQNLIETC